MSQGSCQACVHTRRPPAGQGLSREAQSGARHRSGTQLSPAYAAVRARVRTAVRQRNALFARDGSPTRNSSRVYDEQLVASGTRSTRAGHGSSRGCRAAMAELTRDLAPESDAPAAVYQPSWERDGSKTEDQRRQRCTQHLEMKRREERARRTSLVGPHRDEIIVPDRRQGRPSLRVPGTTAHDRPGVEARRGHGHRGHLGTAPDAAARRRHVGARRAAATRSRRMFVGTGSPDDRDDDEPRLLREGSARAGEVVELGHEDEEERDSETALETAVGAPRPSERRGIPASAGGRGVEKMVAGPRSRSTRPARTCARESCSSTSTLRSGRPSSPRSSEHYRKALNDELGRGSGKDRPLHVSRERSQAKAEREPKADDEKAGRRRPRRWPPCHCPNRSEHRSTPRPPPSRTRSCARRSYGPRSPTSSGKRV